MRGRNSLVTKALIICLFVGMLGTVPQKAEAKEKFAATYNVVKDYGAKSGKDATASIQNALNDAAKKATAKKRVQVYIPAGTYYLTKTLQIGSNTYLKCDKKAKLVKKSGDVLYVLRSVKNTEKGYKGVKNITIEGGIWDSKYLHYTENDTTGGSTFFFVHAQNLEFINLELKNNYGSHLLELGGVKDVVIKNCKLHGFKASSEGKDKEAIQLDICHNDTILPGGEPYDDTPCRNITIENNEIYDYPRAVGSHSLVLGIYHSNVTIRNNQIHDISQNAIYAYNYTDLTVEDNTFTQVHKGVVFKSYAAKGQDTIFKRNKGVKAMTLSNNDYGLMIRNNKITTIEGGEMQEDEGESMMPTGIFVYGADKYPICGITVIGNEIKSAGSAVYLRYVNESVIEDNSATRMGNQDGGEYSVDAYKFMDCSDCSMTGNQIKGTSDLYEIGFAFREQCQDNVIINNQIEKVSRHGIALYHSTADIKKNTVMQSGRYGIAVLEESKATVSGNTVSGAGEYGIAVVDKSEATISSNTVSGVGKACVSVLNDSKAVVDENELSDSKQEGVFVRDAASVTVKNCKVSRSAGNGITIGTDKKASVNDVYVTGNTVTDSGEDGLEFKQVDNVVAVNNQISDSKRYGINVINGTVQSIKANTILGCQRAIFVRSAKVDSVSDNIVYSKQTKPETNVIKVEAKSGWSETMREFRISGIKAGATRLDGTDRDLNYDLTATVDGTKANVQYGKKRAFTITVPALAKGSKVQVMQKDTAGNQVVYTFEVE